MQAAAKWIYFRSLMGSALGTCIAVFLIAAENIHPSGLLDKLILTFCPLYILGFAPFVKSYIELWVITLVGNAIIYGIIFTVGASLFLLFKSAWKRLNDSNG